jgi:hypothetical protein
MDDPTAIYSLLLINLAIILILCIMPKSHMRRTGTRSSPLARD